MRARWLSLLAARVLVASALVASACSAVPVDEVTPTTQDATAETTSTSAAPRSTTTTFASDDSLTFAGTIPAPEFPAGHDWFNVARPLSMQGDLIGKIVLLDFWTQGCVNCLHVIDDLHRLEDEFRNELVVVGVHWAKFDSESDSAAVDQAVRRLGVSHPVINDNNQEMRESYGVNAWPTLALIDPIGNVQSIVAGEGVYERFAPIIATMATEFSERGLIDPTPLDDLLMAPGPLPTVLSFPGKVLADEQRDRLFIADTGRHRVLVADLEGNLTASIGSSTAGAVDGSFEDAQFNQPQGMTLSADGNTLYVADRENHLIRAVDLLTSEVSTIAGTGELLGATFVAGLATDVAIASPWDVERVGNVLYIAGAGRHQIWRLDLASGLLERAAGAGDGREGIDDGAPLSATFSQPSGLAAGDRTIYITDPEASAIRSLDLAPTGGVETLVGTGLFDWGDSVGAFAATQLQHAVGIELVGEADLYVADTYNHRIKRLDLASGVATNVVGNGEIGLADGAGEQAQLSEPSGLSATSTTLYVADTNNHRIRTLDLATGELATLALGNLDVAATTMTGVTSDVVTLAPQQVAPGAVEIVGDFGLPDGYKFNTDGLFTYTWTASNDGAVAVGEDTYVARGPTTPIRFDAQVGDEDFVLTGQSTVFYCPIVDEAFCLVRDITINVPVEIDRDGAEMVTLFHELPSAEELESQLMRQGT